MLRALALVIASVCCLPASAAELFKDIPKNHWAADSVKAVADAGIMKGYPDGTFKGDKPVTRYELAVALQSMVEHIQNSRKPLLSSSSSPQLSTKTHWAKKSTTFLKTQGFLSAKSPILTSGDKPITQADLADALTSVCARFIELTVPPPAEDAPEHKDDAGHSEAPVEVPSGG